MVPKEVDSSKKNPKLQQKKQVLKNKTSKETTSYKHGPTSKKSIITKPVAYKDNLDVTKGTR